MTLEELGAALCAERERRGLLLEDVAAKLKISVRHLRALEEGDTAALPHLAYARGFIRSYAFFLGMVAEEVSEAEDVLGENIVPQKAVYVPEHSGQPRLNIGRIAIAASVFLFLLGSAFLAWQHGLPGKVYDSVLQLAGRGGQGGDQGKDDSQGIGQVMPAEALDNRQGAVAQKQSGEKPGKAVQTVPQTGKKAQGETGQTTAKTGNEAKPGNAGKTANDIGAGKPANAARDGNSKPVQPDAPASGRMGDEPASQAASLGGQPGLHKVIVTATEACSMQSRADSTQKRQFSLRKGDTFALMFVNSLEIRVGNVKAVRLRYDGRDVELDQSSGSAVTMHFPPVAGR